MTGHEIPEITEVSRLVIEPGDRLIVRTATHVSMQQAEYIKERLQELLELPESVRVAVISNLILQVQPGEPGGDAT